MQNNTACFSFELQCAKHLCLDLILWLWEADGGMGRQVLGTAYKEAKVISAYILAQRSSRTMLCSRTAFPGAPLT